MKRWATLSTDRKYRFDLWRVWDDSKPYVVFIGLNPSTVDETANDPTIRRCINFVKYWSDLDGNPSTSGQLPENVIMLQTGRWYEMAPNDIESWSMENGRIRAIMSRSIAPKEYQKEYYEKYRSTSD